MDMSHLAALETRLSHERARLARETNATRRELRKVWIAQIEREISEERSFLGLPETEQLPEMTDEELLAALT